MNIRSTLKKNYLINFLNTIIKAKQQNRKAKKELLVYKKKALENNIKELSVKEILKSLQARLSDRGITPIPKSMGEMNIFVVYSLNNWESVIPLSLELFGNVVEYEWRSHGYDERLGDWISERDKMNQEVLDLFYKTNKKSPVDIVVGYLSGFTMNPEILSKMGESGSVIINFNWDDKLWFNGENFGGRSSGPASIASTVDLNLTNSPESRIKYFVEGGLAMFWPEAGYPSIHKSYEYEYVHDVSFVGGKYGWRPYFINMLKKNGIKVACFGNGWENGPLSDDDMVKLYSRSRINLGFSGVGHSKELMCLKGRDFEVPMSGGLYLTQDNPELSLVYDIGKEIVTYKDASDCVNKIKWLLANPDKAEKIRKSGELSAISKHRWKDRFSEVFQLIGLLR